MTQHKLRELVRAANPVDSASLLSGDTDVRLMYEATMARVRNPQPSTVLLDAPVERSGDMQTQDRPVRLEPTLKPPVRKKWLIPALVAAAAVVIAVAVPTWLLSGTSEPEPDVIQPATTVVTPTPTTTALDIVVEAFRLSEAGDIDGWQALWAPDATWEVTTPLGDEYSAEYFGKERLFDFPRHEPPSDWNGDGEITLSDIDARSVAEFHSVGGNWNADCVTDQATANVVTCQLSPTTVFGKWIAAPNIQTADESNASGGTATITIVDGQIEQFALAMDPLAYADVTATQAAELEYELWMKDVHPERVEELLGPTIGSRKITPDTYREHHRLTADWSTQP